ncbi:MAG TPA: glycosyltransferase family 4 protein [Terriglobales bacterium]|jgi:glycosyltransferase involved in cell wall biosynthesis
MSSVVILTEIIAPYRIPVFNALARRSDVDVHVIFLSQTDPTSRYWKVYKDEICFSYEVLPEWRRRLGGYHVLVNWGLSSALDRVSPEVLVCGGYNYPASWRALRWAASHRVPFLLWTESTAADRRHKYFHVEYLKRHFFERCAGFVVPGLSSLNYVRDLGVTQALTFVAPNAVDNQFFAEKAMLPSGSVTGPRQGLPDRYFLFVGRLVREKGVFDLLEAYAKLSPDIRVKVGLVFVGSGRAERELIERSKAILPGSIQFAGFIQKEELALTYACADMLVFPTHTDPWGLVVNEAMACGLPIICTTVAGCAADLVQDGWNGRVVTPQSVEQLVEAMNSLARSPELRSQMGRHSRERIAHYSPEAWAAGMAAAVTRSRGSLTRG